MFDFFVFAVIYIVSEFKVSEGGKEIIVYKAVLTISFLHNHCTSHLKENYQPFGSFYHSTHCEK